MACLPGLLADGEALAAGLAIEDLAAQQGASSPGVEGGDVRAVQLDALAVGMGLGLAAPLRADIIVPTAQERSVSGSGSAEDADRQLSVRYRAVPTAPTSLTWPSRSSSRSPGSAGFVTPSGSMR